MSDLNTQASALKVAASALLTAKIMSESIERLLIELDVHCERETFPLAMAMEACLEKMDLEVDAALKTLDALPNG
ncbi:MAG: hypothetical protein V4569_04505 [Pseudomonadota bacterium]